MAVYGAQAEPSLVISQPDDGDWFVEPDVDVRGRAYRDTFGWKVDSADFQNGTFDGVSLVDGRLVFNPIKQFEDMFDRYPLDRTKWDVVNGGVVLIRDGTLMLRRADNLTHPLLVSGGDLFPEGMDWSARVIMSFSDTGNFSMGYGWGITANDTHANKSIVSVYSDTSVGNYHSVFVNGQWVSNWGYNDGQLGLLEVKYTHHNDTYMVKLYGRIISTFSGGLKPVRFWIGCPLYEELDEWQWMDVIVDLIDLWTYKGSWTSQVYDMGGSLEFTDLTRSLTTSHTFDSRVVIEARASEDGFNWTEWMKVDQADDGNQTRYFQFRVTMSMEDVRSQTAFISMSNFRLEYQHPLEVVQVRVNGGGWMNATGTDRWNHRVTLAEDDNLLEARVLDRGGYSNLTSMGLTLDTTVPVGTVQMNVEGMYTNDRNITFTFNATDRYGIKGIRIALSEDFRDEEVVEPYVDTMVWPLPGGFVKTDVYIRYEDNHGLFSESAHFVFYYDPLPPTGAVHIMGGAEHTDRTTVSIDLEYQDNEAVASVELSHDEGFTEPVEVTPGVHVHEGWELLPGGTGVRRVYMRLSDQAGNWVVVFDDIELYVATAMGEISPSGGDATTTRLVQVKVTAPTEFDALWMQISEDLDFGQVPWIDLSDYATVILAEGDGERTIHARFKDARGFATLPVHCSVFLDTTPPEIVIQLNGGEYLVQTNSTTVLMQFSDASDAGEMWISEKDDLASATSLPVAVSFQWHFPNIEGVHTLNLWVSDALGNIAHTTDSVYYATQAPQCIPEILDGKYSNAVEELEVEVQVIDHYGLPVVFQIGFDRKPDSTSEWLASGGVIMVPIPNGTADGKHYVYVRGRNSLGLVGEVASTEVILDRKPPTCTILSPKNGSVVRSDRSVVDLKIEHFDENGIVRVSYTIQGHDSIALDPSRTKAEVDVGSFGEHTILVKVYDKAGNEFTARTEFTAEDDHTPWTWSWGILLLIFLVVAFLFYLWKQRSEEQ
jgi:hypothetical protein